MDKAICSGGTFNKILEKLNGIHPDCEILFITKEMASLKLPIVVKEEAIKYLLGLLQDAKSKQSAVKLINEVEANDVDVIWNKIKDQVANRMFEEFGSLYVDKLDKDFINFIMVGKDMEIKDLKSIINKSEKNQSESKEKSQFKNTNLKFNFSENKANSANDSKGHDSKAPWLNPKK